MKLPVGQLLCYIHIGALNVSLIIASSVPSNVSHVYDNVKNESIYLARSKGYNLQTYVSDLLIFIYRKVQTLEIFMIISKMTLNCESFTEVPP